jgi:hypothetical protein
VSDHSKLKNLLSVCIENQEDVYSAVEELFANCLPEDFMQVIEENEALIAENERLSKDRTDWQAECIKRGFTYCRVPDDHYVLADVPEMADLLGLLLGVEVRDREDDGYGDTVSSLTTQVDAGINAFHRAYQAEKERDELKAINFDTSAVLDAAKDEIARLKTENEAQRKDSERYRWLRNPDNREGLELEDIIVVGIAEGEYIVWLEQMDQAIDVMMEGEQS